MAGAPATSDHESPSAYRPVRATLHPSVPYRVGRFLSAEKSTHSARRCASARRVCSIRPPRALAADADAAYGVQRRPGPC